MMLRAVALLALVWPSAGWAVETLRIAMSHTATRVEVSGRGLAFGEDSEDARFTPLPRGESSVSVHDGRLQLDGAPFTAAAVRFRAGDEHDDGGSAGRGAIRVGDTEVSGDVVVAVEGGRLLVVNVIPLEDYVAAVVGSEMPVGFPEEALKAQAVAARTYALQRKLAAYGQAYHLGSSVLSQVYGGLKRLDPKARAAEEATAGQVLTYELEPIEAYFHASCGGRTESGSEALNRDLPYLQSVDCPCGRLPVSRWSLELTPAQLRAEVDPHATSLAVVARSPTGRARRVRVSPDRTLSAVELREKLGYSRLKSLAFDVDVGPGGVLRIQGRGFGHGAGMCQWGAKAYADQGWDYRRILAHYYPGTELQQLY